MLRTLQTNLTGGAISSDAKDRLDLQVWKNSVRRAENVSIKPQGGATRRLGTAIVSALTDSVDYMVEAFVFSQNQSYVCLFSNGRVDIYNRVTRLLVWSAAGQPWTAGMIAAREPVVVVRFITANSSGREIPNSTTMSQPRRSSSTGSCGAGSSCARLLSRNCA